MSKKKTTNHHTLFGILVLSLLCSRVSLAQDIGNCPTIFFPLTAQQIDNDKGDKFSVHFCSAVFSKWQDFIFSIIQHTTPVKSINLTLYEQRMVYDEPTMVEKAKATISYNGDGFELSESGNRFRVWQNVSLEGFGYKESFYNAISGSNLITGAKGRNNKSINCDASECTKVIYERDAKNRVTQASVRNKSWKTHNQEITTMIIVYTYEPYSDYISDIKCYNGDGKVVAEVKYNYLTTEKQLLLSKATYQSYEYAPKGKFDKEQYTYSFSYDLNEIKEVEMYYSNGWGEFVKTQSNKVKVNIVRDGKGNIRQCTCKDNEKTFTWFFTYDENNNWISMTRERKQSGSTEVIKLVRVFIL